MQPEFKIRVAQPSINDDDINQVISALKGGYLSAGKIGEEFETSFSKYIGTNEAVAVNSGTAALHLALVSLGVSSGDEVITTSFTFAATSNVIIQQGAHPVFVDIESTTYNLDPNLIEEALTNKTKAIMPIHYAGQPADMDEIVKIARKNDLLVIEDAAPAVGGIYKNRKAGTLGDIAGFSFFPDKNMTTGEGGMLVTDNSYLAEKAKIMRKNGASRRYYNEYIGWNYKMPDFVAALGLSQLKRIEEIIKSKNEAASYYTEALEKLEWITPPFVEKHNTSTFMLYSIKTQNRFQRDKIIEELKKRGVETRINFPPLHLQPIYVELFGFKKGILPVTEETADTILGLPIHVNMKREDQDFVINSIKEIVRGD